MQIGPCNLIFTLTSVSRRGVSTSRGCGILALWRSWVSGVFVFSSFATPEVLGMYPQIVNTMVVF